MSARIDEAVLYWRPGCPYCRRLRADLNRISRPIREVNRPDVAPSTGNARAANAVGSPAAGSRSTAERRPALLVGTKRSDYARTNETCVH